MSFESLDALFTNENVLKRYALLVKPRNIETLFRLLAVLGNDFLVWLSVKPSRKLQSHGYPITTRITAYGYFFNVDRQEQFALSKANPDRWRILELY